jgi:hypothetical protein
MSDANRVGLAFVVESTFGTFPSGPPTLADLRYTSEDLHVETDTTRSNEIRSDRQNPGYIRTSIRAAGTISGEFSYGAYDTFLEAALQGTWDSAVTVASSDTAVSAANSDNSFNHTGSWDNTPTAGQWIQVSGFTESANNGVFKIVSATSSKIIVEGGTLTDEVAGDSIDITRGAEVKNGVTTRSFSIEKSFEDLANEFEQLTGMTVDTFDLEVPTEGIVTCSFGFLGKIGASAASTGGDGSNTAAASNDIMNSIDHVSGVLEGATLASFDLISLGLSMRNASAPRPQVGSLGAVSMRNGSFEVDGTLQAYYDTKTTMDKYLNNTVTALAAVMEDDDSNVFVFDMPRVKFTSGQRVAGGINTDIIADMAFGVERHTTEDCMMRCVRFPSS